MSYASARSLRALALTLAALAALAWVDARSYRPPAPEPADAPAAQFSALRARATLAGVLGDERPHPLASIADAAVREHILARLVALGLQPHLREGWACDVEGDCGRATNIVAVLPGIEPASGAVLYSTHYDSVPAGPGAGDDGSGVASVLEAARALSSQPPLRHPIILLLDEGEETGLLGAQLFVDRDPLAADVRAVVNLDARGTEGPSLMFETGSAVDWSVSLFAGAAPRPISNSLYYYIYQLLPNDTDFTVFKRAGLQGLNFAFVGGVQRYHTPLDNLANLSPATLQHQGGNSLAVVRALASLPRLGDAPPARAVFFDLHGRHLLHWPARAALPLALVLAALSLALALPLLRRAGAGWRATASGSLVLAAGWLVATLGSAALLLLLDAVRAVPAFARYNWISHPLPMHVVAVAFAFLAPVLAARLAMRGRTDAPGATGDGGAADGLAAWSIWGGFVLLLSVLSTLGAWLAPETSFLLLAPAIAVAVVLVVLARRAPAADGPPAWASAAPLLASAFVFLPSLLLAYEGLGAKDWPILSCTLGFCCLPLSALLALCGAPARRAATWVLAAAVAGGAVVTMALPTWSARIPERVSFTYEIDAAGKARWLANDRPLRDAGSIAMQAPVAELLEASRADGLDHYRLRIRSPRGAPEILVTLPAAMGAEDVRLRWSGQETAAHPLRLADGGSTVLFVGLPPEGLELELATRNAGAISIIDRSYGLPVQADAPRRRPDVQVATQDGDLTTVHASVDLPAPL